MRGARDYLLDEAALTAVAATELTSPLVLLRQLSLALGAAGLSDDEKAKINERLTLTTERALRMASSLNMTSVNQRTLELEPVNPVSICQEVIRELSPLFVAHGQKMTLESRTRIPLLVANRRILQHILLAFSDNALHFGSKDHPISMKITGHADKVRIGVRDYGPAVPIDIWQRIDDRVLRRAVAPIASRPTSSVVGLIAAKRLAETMQSAVGVVRHHDGVTFYVDLRVSGQMSLL